jgi:hypothetical protein
VTPRRMRRAALVAVVNIDNQLDLDEIPPDTTIGDLRAVQDLVRARSKGADDAA